MDLTPAVAEGRQMVESYGVGRFRISGVSYDGSVLVFPDATQPWAVQNTADLDYAALSVVTTAEPPVEVLLIGCGASLAPIPSQLRQRLRDAGIGCDAMDTGAACRTFNILVAESRRVAAALIALSE